MNRRASLCASHGLPVPASDYPATASSGNNGNVAGYLYQDNQTAANSHTAGYTYDYMNRLAKSVASPLQNGGASYNLTFYDMNLTSPKGYDTEGNATCVMESGTSGPCPQLSYDTNTANNHITSAGYTYDATGNVTNDGTHTYQWDAEGRLTSVDSGSTMNYISYDVFGHRVQAQFGGGDYLQYLVDPAGQKEANWFKVAGTWYGQYVRLNGRYVSNYYNSQASFYHPNALGSITQGTTYSGSATGAALLYPWGQGWVPLNNGTIFAGFQDWDGGTDSFPTWFRMYAAGQYRWLTPDPAGLGAADLTNPQSLNRYAYVLNNPATLTDPSGLGTIGPFLWLWKNGGSDSGWGGGGGYDPFSLTGIPVVTDVFTPTQFVSGDTPNTYNGYSVSWKLLTQGGWQTVQLGDAFTLFGAALSGGPSAGPAVPANKGPVVLNNPCSVQGRALPPGAYETQGQQANSSTVNFVLDVAMGWPRGDYLDPQPLASGDKYQNQAYGNYVFGVYMQAAGFSFAADLIRCKLLRRVLEVAQLEAILGESDGPELFVSSGGQCYEHHKRI